MMAPAEPGYRVGKSHEHQPVRRAPIDEVF
jgi:hypothetical protein